MNIQSALLLFGGSVLLGVAAGLATASVPVGVLVGMGVWFIAATLKVNE